MLGVDLVGTVTSWGVALDDPLPHLMADARVVRTRELNDGLWVRVDDVVAAFGARSYGAEAVRRADALFVASPLPHCQTAF